MINILSAILLINNFQTPSDTIFTLTDEEVTDEFIKNQITEESSNITLLLEKIEYYKINKIDINNSDISEIILLPGMNNPILENIIQIKKDKNISRNEFINYDPENYIMMRFISQFLNFESLNETVNIKIRERIINKSSFESKSNSPYTNYTKLQFETSDYQIASSFERDAGELSKYGSIAFYFQLNQRDILNKLIIGNYNAQIGQGLLLSSKSKLWHSTSDVDEMIKEENKFRGTVSTETENILKGIATSLKYKNLDFDLFYSSKKLSATLDSLGNIKSFYDAGYYRTETEIAKINQLHEKLFGIVLSYKLFPNIIIGTGFRRANYTKIISDKYLETSNFNESIVKTIYTNLNFNNFKIVTDFSGKENIFVNKGFGLQFLPTNKINIVFHFRDYSDLYNERYVNPFSIQSSNNKKEVGMYYGIEMNIPKQFILNAFADNYKITEYNFIQNSGSEIGIKIIPKFVLNNFFIELKRKNNFILTETNKNTVIDKIRLQYSRDYKKIKISNKIEYLILKSTNNIPQKSYQISNNINYFISEKLKLHLAVTIYKTSSYESRLYDFNSNSSGYIYFSPLIGDGIKTSLVLNYLVFEKIKSSIRYSSNSVYKSKDNYSLPIERNNELILQFDFKNY
ncbi:MAG: hypothetical protein O3A55_07555 [Bacteroidetes bacterium]|nr:hypothetical protein [Bacteroidota bacterium]